MRAFRPLTTSALLLVALCANAAAPRAAVAGPPLICWAIDVGEEESLPWGDGPMGARKDYDLARLVPDTLAILGRKTSVLAKMETLRRATVYGSLGDDREKGRAAVWELAARLMGKALDAEAAGRSSDPAWFVAGYFVAACAQAREETGFDGVAWALRAKPLLGAAPQARFALALMTAMGEGNRAAHRAHLKAAIDGSKDDPLLRKNIERHFVGAGATLDSLRATLDSP